MTPMTLPGGSSRATSSTTDADDSTVILRRAAVAAAPAVLALLLAAPPPPSAAAAQPVPGTAADDPTAADDAAGIVILDVGDQSDTVVLSLDWLAVSPAGTVLRNVELNEGSGVIAIAGQTLEFSATSELTEIREVLGSDESGTSVRITVDEYRVDADSFSEQLRDGPSIETLLGIPLIASFDSDGARVGVELEDASKPTPDQLRGLDELLANSDALVLPATPLGVGARWTAPYDDTAMLAGFELVELSATSATLSFQVSDITAFFADEMGAADATPGPDAGISGTITLSRPGQPLNYRMTGEARLQYTTDDPDTGLTYEFDLLTVLTTSLTTV